LSGRASFFDAISGVKKLTIYVPAITYPTLANDASVYRRCG